MLIDKVSCLRQLIDSSALNPFQILKSKFSTRSQHVKKTKRVVRPNASNLNEPQDVPFMNYGKSKNYNRVYSWGLAEHGALGYLPKPKRKRSQRPFFFRPLRIHFAYQYPITKMACGYGFTIFGTAKGCKEKVFGSGINSDGQIGYHDPRRNNPLCLVLAPVPVYIPYKSPKTVEILQLSAGRAHCAILSTEGVHFLGHNAYGQCGRPIVENEDYIRNKVPSQAIRLGNEKIVSVCCGQDHSMFITESGKVYACGWGADGQTGLGHHENEWQPSLVKGDIQDEKIVKISCKSDCVLALNDKGDVFAWGNSEYGQLMRDDAIQQVNVPMHMKKLKGLGKILDIASGGTNCAVINEEGKVFTWGFGILGNGPNVYRNPVPTLIPPPLFGCNEISPDTKVVRIEAGLTHFAAITNYGNLYTWGRNQDGQLGLGHLREQYFPLQVSLGAVVKEVSCGVDHTVAMAEPFI
nr:PREDICTED: Williams-Beuren syndrome chromosomal region 16 protein-like isoform X1 [Bemisia tabaci]